jgi:hypothetical protein
MLSALFFPDRPYDYRIWADIQSSLRGNCAAVFYDRYQPMPWAEPGSPDFLTGVRRLAPGRGRIAVAAGHATGFAVRLARAGLADALVLFHPAPDYFPLDASVEIPADQLIENASRFAPLIDALRLTGAARRELVTETIRGIYREHLSPGDLELACLVAGEHAEESLAAVAAAVTAARAGMPPPRPGLPWLDQLAGIGLPLAVVLARPASWMGTVIARRAQSAQIVTADAQTDLVWLEDRGAAAAALNQTIARLCTGSG